MLKINKSETDRVRETDKQTDRQNERMSQLETYDVKI